jgi:glycosyltransferase involved in cell wall biosynthesis
MAAEISTTDKFPKLLYLGDAAVESTHHGSALLYRLLDGYPPDRLAVIESGMVCSRLPVRLPGVEYFYSPIGNSRLLNSRFHVGYASFLSVTAGTRARYVRKQCSGFCPDAVLTVAHGFGWLTAASFARKLKVPLHLVVHDDWPRIANTFKPCSAWLDSRFGAIYRQAQSRFCVSPYMVEDYLKRYQIGGTVLYPSRSVDCPVWCPVPARELAESDEFVIGYAGNSSGEVLTGLCDLAAALIHSNSRLVIFGPFDHEAQQKLLSISSRISFLGMVGHIEMMRALRGMADLLFVPMGFESHCRNNASIAFPSKLADYTAMGVPVLIYGPPYCSAVRWVEENADSGEIVSEQSSTLLHGALSKLRSMRTYRDSLATGAMRAGNASFGFDVVRRRFYESLMM